MTSALTPNQTEAMNVLSQYVGKKVQVLTSGYTANVNPAAVAASVGTFSSAALRGLQAKGFIKIELAYWKGATITVLQAA
jgi:hypothetical protein